MDIRADYHDCSRKLNKLKDQIEDLEKENASEESLKAKRAICDKYRQNLDLVKKRLNIRKAEVEEKPALAATLRKELEKLPGFEITMLSRTSATASTSVSQDKGTDNQSKHRSSTRKNSGSPKAKRR